MKEETEVHLNFYITVYNTDRVSFSDKQESMYCIFNINNKIHFNKLFFLVNVDFYILNI